MATEKSHSDNKYQLVLTLTWAGATEEKNLRRKGRRNGLRLGENKGIARTLLM